jgi:hypothetical protein
METAQQLVGRQVLRNFGKHGIHKGTIASFDAECELTFRVEYEDGDSEDLAEADVRLALLDKVITISARSHRSKEKDNSESDYIDDEDNSNRPVIQVPNSQATTQPLEDTVEDEATIPTRVSAVRKRTTTPVRQRSSSALWIQSPCPLSITIHYNAVDRGLCAQTLREHHTILERAMVRLYPRFKWGRSHYLQVQPLLTPATIHSYYVLMLHKTLPDRKAVVMVRARNTARLH